MHIKVPQYHPTPPPSLFPKDVALADPRGFELLDAFIGEESLTCSTAEKLLKNAKNCGMRWSC